MSANTAHANNGVLIHSGEWILLFCDNVQMEFAGQDDLLFKGSKSGRIYLTTHRMIFNSKHKAEPMQSFSFPFVAMSDIDIEQPIMGSNYIKGKVRAQPNGNWNGEAKFKIYFKAGGAIDFGQAMKRAACLAQRYMQSDSPPPYTPPTGSWYEAPPPAYQAPQGFYGWIPSSDAFSHSPPPNTVFMNDNPPPYPGISGQAQPTVGLNTCPNKAANFSPGNVPGPFVQASIQTSSYSGDHGAQDSYPGYTNNLPLAGYPAPANMGYPRYSVEAPGTSTGNIGFTSRTPQNSKEVEATQNAYYDPSRPQTAYVPPPAYYEPPPSYDSVSKKNQ